MQAELGLFPEPATEDSEAWFARLERFITRGREIRLDLGMTVCDMHQMWDDLWERGDRAERHYLHLASRCRAVKTTNRLERHRLKQLTDAATERAHCAKGIPESRFLAAQEQLATSLGLVEDLSEVFFMDIQDRPGIEHTWQMTLQAVLDHLKQHYRAHYEPEPVTEPQP